MSSCPGFFASSLRPAIFHHVCRFFFAALSTHPPTRRRGGGGKKEAEGETGVLTARFFEHIAASQNIAEAASAVQSVVCCSCAVHTYTYTTLSPTSGKLERTPLSTGRSRR